MKTPGVLITGALTGIAASFMGVCIPATGHSGEARHIEQVRTFLNGFPDNGANQLAAFIDGTYIEHAPASSRSAMSDPGRLNEWRPVLERARPQ
jgi:hypothetical protein